MKYKTLISIILILSGSLPAFVNYYYIKKDVLSATMLPLVAYIMLGLAVYTDSYKSLYGLLGRKLTIFFIILGYLIPLIASLHFILQNYDLN